jgi:hypothetical protein
MNRVWWSLSTRARSSIHAKRWLVMSATVLATSVSLLGYGTTAVSADTTPTDQALASQLAASIAAGAVQIHQLTERYDQAVLTESTIQDRLAMSTRDLVRTQAEMHRDLISLRQEAVTAYIGQSSPVAPDTQQVSAAALEAEYIQVAAGSVSDTVQQLQLHQSQIHDEEATLVSERNAAAQAIGAATSARNGAIAAAQAAQNELNEVQGRIAHLVAVAEAEKVAEQESLARAANQSNREALSRAVQVIPVVSTRTPPPSQGQPVNNGLLTAVTISLSSGSGDSVAAPPPPPAPSTARTASPASTASPVGGAFAALRQCESGGNYAEDTGNGFYGAYQFSESTWEHLGHSGYPNHAPPAEQDAAAERLEAEAGWSQWPACAAALGLIS